MPDECNVAIKGLVAIEVRADTIHAFASTSRIFNRLFNDPAEMGLSPGPGATPG